VIAIAQIPLVQSGIITFTTRWNQAALSEGGGSGSGAVAVKYRTTEGFVGVFDTSSKAPFWGMGMGRGSNFAVSYMGGESLALGESAWDREVNELGSLFGLGFLFLRVIATATIGVMSFRALRRNIVLPLYLLPVSSIAILIGNLDQPTSQGFLVVSAFLSCASFRADPSPE
jgi:hypothetical protein